MVLTQQHIAPIEQEPQVYIGYLNGKQVQFVVQWNEALQCYEQVVIQQDWREKAGLVESD